ncbi:type II toxin-antitoxin system HicB family antitoxin [Acidisoma silvae]|uniref:Type II toxin-antitoxin system HicB family antitoxin n=1 Tax=Acidisoma silvae TaxID=2802396 RepID=A0A963YR54_9PROT|nr:type II toxin-antitoxin system HicB family antitoxin [Acidisoma silvae]MCB8875316.1 type II toxin-antitoxin system HicB family antitoxin [Acidisoma silvae]
MNTLTIDGLKAVISFDEEAGQFRGEFLGLNGGADFYADSVEGLMEEGRASLRAFLSVCAENGIEPYRSFSGKFLVRIPETLHADAVHTASARGVSLNDLVRDAITHEITS